MARKASLATRTAAERIATARAGEVTRQTAVGKSRATAKKTKNKASKVTKGPAAPAASRARTRAPVRRVQAEPEEEDGKGQDGGGDPMEEDDVDMDESDDDNDDDDDIPSPTGAQLPIRHANDIAKARVLQLKLEALERQAAREIARDNSGGVASGGAFVGMVEDDDGESTLSPSQIAILPLFKDHNKRDLILLALNKFNPLNLLNRAL